MNSFDFCLKTVLKRELSHKFPGMPGVPAKVFSHVLPRLCHACDLQFSSVEIYIERKSSTYHMVPFQLLRNNRGGNKLESHFKLRVEPESTIAGKC